MIKKNNYFLLNSYLPVYQFNEFSTAWMRLPAFSLFQLEGCLPDFAVLGKNINQILAFG